MTPEEFIKAEEDRLAVLDKFFNHHPHIHSTQALASLRPLGLTDTTVVHRSPIGKITAVLLSICLFWTAYVFVKMQDDLRLPTPVLGLLLFVLLGIACFALWRNFLYRAYRYDIVLNKEYIQVGDQRVPWADTTDTYIMSKREGKVTNNWLVLFKTDESVQQFELFKFSINMNKLAAMIEYYKHKRS